MRSRFYTTPVPQPVKTIILPDDQRFTAGSLAHIGVAGDVLSIYLSGIAAPVTFTAANSILAWYLMRDIFTTVADSTISESSVRERGLSGVSIASLVPDPLTAAGMESVTLTGVGFFNVTSPVINITIGGSGGITWYECSDVVVVSDTEITMTTPVLVAAGTAYVILSVSERENIAATKVTSIV